MVKRTIPQRSQLLNDIHEFCINVDTREIWIHSYIDGNVEGDNGIDYRTSNTFNKNLRFLEGINEESILIHMHTIGGYWEDGMAIYDCIKNSSCHITILVHAQASSMSSIILQAADTRVMMPNSHFMMHYGTFAIDNTSIGAISAVEELKKCNEIMLNIYTNKCKNGEDFKEFKELGIRTFLDKEMKNNQEIYLTPEQTIKYGLADGILGSTEYPNIKGLLS